MLERKIKPKKWTPHDYQRRAVKFLVTNPHGGLLLYPGMGKTSITLAALKILKMQKRVKKILVVAPLRILYGVWPAQIQQWEDFSDFTYSFLHDDRDAGLQKEADIYLINPEGMEWLFLSKAYRQFDALVVDESTKFKRTNTKRFKYLKSMIPYFSVRWILTGGFVANSIMDAFGQIYIVDQGEALGKYITHFRKKYFYKSGYRQHSWGLIPGSEKRIYEAIGPKVLQLSADDYLNLPDVVVNEVEVNLPLQAKKMYDEFEDKLFTILENEPLYAANAAVATGKCRQIAGGAVYTKEKDWAKVHDEKIEALLDILEELQGSPAIVTYEFGHERDRIVEALGKVSEVSGDTKPRDIIKVEADWNAGRIPVLLGQTQSISRGLNLQGGPGHNIVLFSLPWDYEAYDQLLYRLKRQGASYPSVIVHHLVAKDTVDEAVRKALKTKNKTQKSMEVALSEYGSLRHAQ